MSTSRPEWAAGSSSMSSSARHETFTEAVPLSLSSLAHQSIPLNEGVLDGLSQVLQHTLLQCVNYARIAMQPAHPWSFADLTTTPFAWTPYKRETNDTASSDLPFALQKMSFVHQYTKNAWIYLSHAVPADLTAEMEKEMWKQNDGNSNWSQSKNGILARISLLYTSTEALTKGELDGTDTEDMPPCILYKIIVEYRSLPATGNQHAVQAEELSMLSFGGSADDDVKYGALASLYDEHAKYVLEIYSVRGKKYKFDLMDSTLANGTIPRLPSRDGVGTDPTVKGLCVTVTDQTAPDNNDNNNNNNHNDPACKPLMKHAVITRMHLTMEGKLRQHEKGLDKCFEGLPPFDYMTNAISCAFLRLNPNPPQMISASPSGHTLVLDSDRAGDIYVNGRYVTTWGDDPGVGSHGVALFSMDLHSVPFWNGRIVDYEVMKEAYAQLWHEVLVDARLLHLNIARKLLYRLMKGVDPHDEDDEADWYDTDGEDDACNNDAQKDCLEALVLAAPQYDRVGIAAKALATRFSFEFGKFAFPCQAHETEWVKSILPDREPIVVPQRLISILRRGGYFDAQKTADLLWFSDSRPARDGLEVTIVATAVRYLEEAGCTDVDSENVVFVQAPVADNAIAKDAVCRWNTVTEQFYVHEGFFTTPVDEYIGVGTVKMDETRIKGYLLGMYIAKAHPAGYGKVLARYLLRNSLS